MATFFGSQDRPLPLVLYTGISPSAVTCCDRHHISYGLVPLISEASNLIRALDINVIRLFLIAFLTIQPLMLEAAPASSGKSERLVKEAETIIDSWAGGQSVLVEAGSMLNEALELTPEYPEAYVQLARVVIKLGYINSTGSEMNFRDGTLRSARRLLDTAMMLDAESGNVLVLYGHVATLEKRYEFAERLLSRADKLGVVHPWLHLNFAALYLKTNRPTEAAARYQMVINSGTSNLPVLLAAYNGLRNYYKSVGDMDKVEETYLSQIQLDPNRAWLHGNYANFLLSHRKSEIDKAIFHAERALSLMDYPLGRRLYLKALCRKLEIVSDTAKVNEIEAKARSVDPEACASAIIR